MFLAVMDGCKYFFYVLPYGYAVVGWLVCYGYDMIEARVRFAWKRSS